MNSGDTGGILDTDWLGIRWDKVCSMMGLILPCCQFTGSITFCD